MSHRNDISVTKIPCSCGYLARGARNPYLPIKFDVELNEYLFEHTLPTGTKMMMMIYHCPICGGVASESKRGKLFAEVTRKEALRLDAIIAGLKTVEDIEARLGAADEDRTYDPSPEVAMLTGKPEVGPVRVLTFTRLSKTADVQLQIRATGEIEGSIGGKYLGAAGRRRKSRAKPRRRRSRSR